MKLMIASDIHGSMFYLEKLLTRFEAEKPDKLILLGDILYHGPRNDLPKGYDPKRVITLLNSIKDVIIAINGNCDAEVDRMVLDFPILSDPQQITIDGKRTVLTHGHKYDFSDFGKLILHGHTHVLRAEKNDKDSIIVNPGSVSIPKDGNPNSFAILSNGIIKIFDFDMNVIKSINIK